MWHGKINIQKTAEMDRAIIRLEKKKQETSMSKNPVYGPGNPHPLSAMRTELVWDGKYDDTATGAGGCAGCAMPMQKIETVDKPRSEAAAQGQLGPV